MVDFNKLRTQQKRSAPIQPIEIFRRLPKPSGFNDLYTSQAEVLESWFERRNDRDVVLKLHTGGGKTLVGLLMAQSTLNETNEPVLYLAPTNQLVNQTLDKARLHNIPAVPYEAGKPLAESFLNGKAIMVATYSALFNGVSRFGVRGSSAQPIKVGAVILDDAHAAFSVIRDHFTLTVSSDKQSLRYKELTGLFRHAFRDIERGGTFDDITAGSSGGVIEVPYWAWQAQIDTVQAQLRADAQSQERHYKYVWPLLRDNLHLCHALVSHKGFTITPILPLVQAFPTFSDAPRRIYMSATIADDSEIIRTFDADPALMRKPLTSRSLAGVSERMILIPDLMPAEMKVREVVGELMKWTSAQNKGSVVLTSSGKSAATWASVATVAEDTKDVESLVSELQQGLSFGPFAFANRYDGIDLHGDACRLLVIYGLPAGTSDYELLRSNSLFGSGTINRILAQRIEQGIGRGARGAGDYCVVILCGSDIAGWVAKDANFKLLTSATRTQVEMGSTVSKEIKTLEELTRTIETSYKRDPSWVGFHAETLGDTVDVESAVPAQFNIAATERKAFNLWQDSYSENAIARLTKLVSDEASLDGPMKGWLLQFAARVASHWGQTELSQNLQQDAFSRNRNLLRPKTLPPYRPLVVPGAQADALASQLGGYRIRRGLLNTFEEVVSHLHPSASSNQFEKALVDFAELIGLSAERHDRQGQGPDVLWLLPNKGAFVIEAKSRKLEKNALTKEQHGQLAIAEKWFQDKYPDFQYKPVSVQASAYATKAAEATKSYALTFEKLAALISDARMLLKELCNSQLDGQDLKNACQSQLSRSNIRAERIEVYLQQFKEV